MGMRDIENMPLIDALRAAVTPEPLFFGNEKVVFDLFPGHLLIIPRDDDFSWTPEGRLQQIEDALKSTTSLKPPYYGAQRHLLTQPQLATTIPDGYEFPDIAIHRKIDGITLERFLEITPNAAKIIQDWPPETFRHLMMQAKVASAKGHWLDCGQKNTLVTGPHTKQPLLTLIDHHYNAGLENKPTGVISIFYGMEHYTTPIPIPLLEKLVTAAESVGFGLNELDLIGNARWGIERKVVKPYIDRLSAVAPVYWDKKPHIVPRELSELGELSWNATTIETLVFLRRIAAADRAINPTMR